MSKENKLFLPLFYSALEITGSLDDAEFGRLIRELLRSGGNREYTPKLPRNLVIAYNFMLEDARRIFNLGYTEKEQYKKSSYGKKHYVTDTDADEVFEKALARTCEKR